MKQTNLIKESNKMSIIRIAPVCGGKIYVTKHSLAEEKSPHMDLPIVENATHVSAKSDRTACKVKEKFHRHLHTDAAPRLCVKHRSSMDKEATIFLYILPLKSEDEIHFHEGEFVTSEDISNHPEAYAPDLLKESELLGMAAELWEDFYHTEI